MNKSVIILIISLIYLTVASCDYLNLKSEDVSEVLVASVGSKNLYKSDLEGLYVAGMNVKDSTLVINNFIENWAKKQIYLQKAALNLSTEKEEILEDMVKEYREDLFINSYKKALVVQNLDTIISDKAIRDFYITNQNIFKLNEELLKYKYISFNTYLVESKDVKKLFLSEEAESVESLLEDEYKFSTVQLNDSVWYSYSDLIQTDAFIKSLNKSSLLRKNKFIQQKDSTETHFIQVKDILKRNEIAPLEYVKPVIKQMILHKKRLQYINEIEAQLIQEAINTNIYIKQ